MYNLPTSVEVNGKAYKITNNGDYRMVLDCFAVFDDEELSEDEKVLALLLIFYNDFKCVEDISELDENTVKGLMKEMFKFFNCGGDNSIGVNTNRKLIDWQTDELIVTAAINNVARTEIRLMEFLHWWTFMGYYMSVGESVLSTVVGIRHKIVTGKKLEKHEKEFKQSNPEYFNWNSQTQEEKELDEWARSIWNSGV